MNHYTYRLIFQDGRQYIGVRSCKCEPQEDIKYLGKRWATVMVQEPNQPQDSVAW